MTFVKESNVIITMIFFARKCIMAYSLILEFCLFSMQFTDLNIGNGLCVEKSCKNVIHFISIHVTFL